MAQGIKIVQLTQATSITDNDSIPFTRGGIETFRIPAGIFVTNGFNIGQGPGQLFSAKTNNTPTTLQFRTLSASGESLSIATVGNTVVISASGQNPVKRTVFGDGVTTVWPITPFNSVNAANYRIDIDGVLQEAFVDYNISNNNIVFTSAPPLSGKVVIVSSNITPLTEAVVSPNSVTNEMLQANSVGNLELSALSVTTDKIALSAVTTDKIALSAVTADKINLVTSLSSNGYQRMPGGLIIQWGESEVFSTETSLSANFPIPFTSMCFNVQATWKINTEGAAVAFDTWAQTVRYDTNRVLFRIQNSGVATITPGRVAWFAVGY